MSGPENMENKLSPLAEDVSSLELAESPWVPDQPLCRPSLKDKEKSWSWASCSQPGQWLDSRGQLLPHTQALKEQSFYPALIAQPNSGLLSLICRSAYKWTCAVQKCAVQGSTVFLIHSWESKYVEGQFKLYIGFWQLEWLAHPVSILFRVNWTTQISLYIQCDPHTNLNNILFCRNRKIHTEIDMKSQETP